MVANHECQKYYIIAIRKQREERRGNERCSLTELFTLATRWHSGSASAGCTDQRRGRMREGQCKQLFQEWIALQLVLCNLRCLFSVVKAGQQFIITYLNLFLLKLALCYYQMNHVSIPLVIFVRRLTLQIQALKTLKIKHKTLLYCGI